MKKISFLLFLILFSESLLAQNLLFVGEKSYPSTETFNLKSNADFDGNDLDVSIARNGESGIISVSTSTMSAVLIKGKLIIYLDNGTVITCIDRNLYDHVDNISTTLYYLTKDEIEQLKHSNINTIRFALKCGRGCTFSSEEGNYSVRNATEGSGYFKKERTDVPTLIQNLFY